MRLLTIWNDWAIYDIKYLNGLQAIYLAEDMHFDRGKKYYKNVIFM